jgi:Transposase domain (DUF772)
MLREFSEVRMMVRSVRVLSVAGAVWAASFLPSAANTITVVGNLGNNPTAVTSAPILHRENIVDGFAEAWTFQLVGSPFVTSAQASSTAADAASVIQNFQVSIWSVGPDSTPGTADDVLVLGPNRHPLVRLAAEIDWDFLAGRFSSVCRVGPGQPPLPTRLVAGLFILKHMPNLSDEALCERWVENPYFQYFCGEVVFRHELPFDRSSLTRWRRRLGEEQIVTLLQESLSVAIAPGRSTPKISNELR